MALVTLVAPYSKFSGKAGAVESGGATVLYSSRNRSISRTHVIPANPKSAAQVSQRGYLQAAADAFQGLTVAEAAEWETFGANFSRKDVFSRTYHLSAIQAYVAVNAIRLMAGQTVNDTPPAYAYQAAPTAVAIAYKAGDTSYKFTLTHGLSEGFWLIKWSPALPGSARVARATDLRAIGVDPDVSIIAISSSPQSIILAADLLVSDPGAAARVGCQVQSFSSGYVPGAKRLEQSITIGTYS